MNGKLQGVRLLVVEDEFLSAMELKRMIEDLGGYVVGPVARLADAQKLVASEHLDGAVLDVKLDGDTTLALATDLMGRNIPVVFTTGYETNMLPAEFANTPRLSKPYNDGSLRAFVERNFKPAGRPGRTSKAD